VTGSVTWAVSRGLGAGPTADLGTLNVTGPVPRRRVTPAGRAADTQVPGRPGAAAPERGHDTVTQPGARGCGHSMLPHSALGLAPQGIPREPLEEDAQVPAALVRGQGAGACNLRGQGGADVPGVDAISVLRQAVLGGYFVNWVPVRVYTSSVLGERSRSDRVSIREGSSCTSDAPGRAFGGMSTPGKQGGLPPDAVYRRNRDHERICSQKACNLGL